MKNENRLSRLRPGGVGACIAVLLAASLALPQPAPADTIVVDNPVIGDGADGLCDLVEAIENANDDAATNGECEAGNGADVIVLTLDVTLDQVIEESIVTRGPIGLPQILSEMTITSGAPLAPEGEVPTRTIARDPGSVDDFRHLYVGVGGNLTLDNVVLTGGLVQNVLQSVGHGAWGGAIFNEDTLTLTNTTVSGNAVSNDAQVSTSVYPYAYGGGIFNLGTLTLTDSTVSGNTVYAVDTDSMAFVYAAAGGVANGSFHFGEAPTMVLSYSTVSGNTSHSVGDRSVSYGGGVNASYGAVTITNSTLSGNTVQSDGDILTLAYGGALGTLDGTVTLTHSTVAANNKIETGAGIDPYAAGIDGISGGGSVTLYGSLVGFSNGENCLGVIDGGGNLADDDTCDTIPATLAGLDPVLADNGGASRTHRTTSTTNARDAGGACGLATDQRGVSRSEDGLCDLGSYEFFCTAPDEDVVLADDVLAIERIVEVCGMITGGPSYEIVAGGNLIARVGSRMVLDNGFSVEAGGLMSVEIDPSIQMPDEASVAAGMSARPAPAGGS